MSELEKAWADVYWSLGIPCIDWCKERNVRDLTATSPMLAKGEWVEVPF